MLLLAVGRIMDGTSVYKYIFADTNSTVYMISPSFVFSDKFVNNAVISNCDITKSTANSKGSISGVNGFELSKNTIQKNYINSYSEVFELVIKTFIPYVKEFELKKVAKDRKKIQFCDKIILGNTSGISLGDNCQVIGCNNTSENDTTHLRERKPGVTSTVKGNKMRGSNNCIIEGDSDEAHSTVYEDHRGNKIMTNGELSEGSGFKRLFNLFKKK